MGKFKEMYEIFGKMYFFKYFWEMKCLVCGFIFFIGKELFDF